MGKRKEVLLVESGLIKKFIRLVLKYGNDWKKINHLPQDEYLILMNILAAARINFKKLVIGRLYLCATCDQRVINDLCPFKVIAKDLDESYRLTGWLNELFRRVLILSEKHPGDEDELAVFCENEIRRAVALQPIKLNSKGDWLVEIRPKIGRSFFVNHISDQSSLECGCQVGEHWPCGGVLKRVPKSDKRDMLICDSCNLQTEFVKSFVKTYGDLRDNLEDIRSCVIGFTVSAAINSAGRSSNKKRGESRAKKTG